MSTVLRHWLAGLVEVTALLTDHISDGLQALAEHIDPDTPDGPDEAPDTTTVVDGDHTHHLPGDGTGHTTSEDCPCIPRVTGFAATGHGDHWTYTHNPLED